MSQTNGSGIAAARREFLRRFFHDLATPLSAVSLHLEGADRRARRGGDPAESLTIARAELGKAFDLFDLGRDLLLEEPQPSSDLDLDDLVRAAAESHPGVRVEGKTGSRVHGDPKAIAAAIGSLVVNAVEASEVAAVILRVERDGARLRVRIENPGALPDNVDGLFSPKSARPGKNWGMGLARARLLAADAGGTVRLEQSDGRVVATIDLPEVSS
ncbi:MAG: ATP-binding protein [Acidobacteriota bacterium]